MNENSYRRRIYDGYVTARAEALAPASLSGLRPRMPYLHKIVHEHIPANKDARLLELGCGHGAFLYALRSAGYTHARGVDGSAQQVEAANRLGIAGVHHGDALETLASTKTASQDVVVAFDFIEHFTKAELIPLVDEVMRVLKPGGRWILHVPNSEGPLGGRMRGWDFTHELSFTRISLTQLLLASGFESVRCFEDRPIPHGLKSAVRATLWVLIRSMLLFYVAVETGDIDRRAIFSQNLLAIAYKVGSTA